MTKIRPRRIFGIGLIVLGLSILFAGPFKITGAIIGLETVGEVWFYLIGAVLIVGGVILESERAEAVGGLEKTLTKSQKKIARAIDNALRSGKMGTYKELKNYASALGYVLKDKSNHVEIYQANGSTPLMYRDHPVTIPRHNEKKGTYRGILQGLREGLVAA